MLKSDAIKTVDQSRPRPKSENISAQICKKCVGICHGQTDQNFYRCSQISTHLTECASFSLYLGYTNSIQFQLVPTLFSRLECSEMCSNQSKYAVVVMLRAVYICYKIFLLYEKAVAYTTPTFLVILQFGGAGRIFIRMDSQLE